MMDTTGYLKFLFALAFVLALMLALSWLTRRFGPGNTGIISRRGERRLKVVEQVVLDARRRMVLVQRDNTQHLLLLGVNAETVIETGLQPLPAQKSSDTENGDIQ